MFSVIKGIWEGFWELFIFLTFVVCIRDVYVDIKKEVVKKQARGIPSIMKFNDKLWGRK